MEIYVVKPGDTLYSVAGEYALAPQLLSGMNGLREDAELAVGQALVVRRPERVHVVSAGDTLYGIARAYGVPLRQLYRNNVSLGGRSELLPGEMLVVDYAEGPTLGAIGVNGYAYPYVEDNLLETALPYLTYLTPFTYGIGADGTLLSLNDEALLSAAARYGAKSLMHLSTLTETGNFSNERSSLLLGSRALQEKLADSVVETMGRKGYYGLDVDFEYVLPRERLAYADFIRLLRDRLNPLGHPVVVALAPKNRADQPGLLYEAHDYALLGEAANAVLLMTYGSDC